MVTRKLAVSAAALFLSLPLCLGACSAGDQGAESEANRANAGQQRIRAQQTIPEPSRNEDNIAVARRLEKLALSIPEVQNANCVVFGDTAIVGIDVAGTLDRSSVGTIKYAVAEALRKDPQGVNAIVTADMDLSSRIKEIGDDIRAGRPLAGFAEELADLVGRIIPQLPKDTKEREDTPPQPQATSQEQGAKKLNGGK